MPRAHRSGSFSGRGDARRWRHGLLEACALEGDRNPVLTKTLGAMMPRIGLPPISRDELARIGVPTRLIRRRHDLQTPLETAEAAAARHGWPLHVVDDAADADDPAHEQPEQFLGILRGVLTRERASR